MYNKKSIQTNISLRIISLHKDLNITTKYLFYLHDIARH